MEDLPNRKAMRLQAFDYSNKAYYYVTICTKNKEHLFCNITGVGNGLDRSVVVTLTEYGKIAAADILDISNHFTGVIVDTYAIMPNHIHAIVVLTGGDGMVETERSRPFPTLSVIMGQYKSGVSRKCGRSIWQKSYYDHIIRDELDYFEKANYIQNNPAKWLMGEE